MPEEEVCLFPLHHQSRQKMSRRWPNFPLFYPGNFPKIFYKILILHLSYLLLTWYNYQVSILEGMEAEFGLTNIHNLYTFQNLIVVLYECTECPNMG